MDPSYIAIDLKSYYASVECADRGLNPLSTNLVVADRERTEKTICLAVSPSLKSFGVPGRPRLFEVSQKIKEINAERLSRAVREGFIPNEPGQCTFKGASFDLNTLNDDPSLELIYLTAPPRMARYEEVSAQVYKIYLKYIAPEDILVYSIDEVFIDASAYLNSCHSNAYSLAKTMILDVLETTGITATAGIGTNLYLAKVAMDIVAKHAKPDKNGVRIASLDEKKYRTLLWGHRPITDFWNVGPGISKKLSERGLYTMGDIARCSLGGPQDYYNEELLYKKFGVKAQLLIDHAWGIEPCTMADIKAYRPESHSISTGQVLPHPYSSENARLIAKEMADTLSLRLVNEGLVTRHITLYVGYDRESLSRPGIHYTGPVCMDGYGRPVPAHARGSLDLEEYTCTAAKIMAAVSTLFNSHVNPDLLVRRITICADTRREEEAKTQPAFIQLDLFTDYDALQAGKEEEKKKEQKEKNLQKAILDIRARYGKNAIVRGMNLLENANEMKRNETIGGHKA